LKNTLQSRWFTFLAVIVIGFFLLSIIKLKPSLETVSQEVNNLDQKIAEAQNDLSELQKLGDYFKGVVYLEREARLKLNYKNPGENVVFVYKNQHAQSPAKPDDTTKPSLILPNWQKWLNYLLNR